jgi:hypothetical protein
MRNRELEDVVVDASGDLQVASTVRTSVHDVVEEALAKVPGDEGTRADIRAAGRHLGNALAAHADAAESPARAATSAARRTEDAGQRARAFRRMAGVQPILKT